MRGLAALAVLASVGIGQPTFSATTVDIGRPYADLTEVDLDGDGRKDLLFAVADPPAWIACYQEPDGAFGGRRTWPVPRGTAAIVLADVVPPVGHDVVLLSSDGARVLAGTAPAGARPPVWLRSDLVFPPGYDDVPGHWDWGRDVDGDGRHDVLLPGLHADLLVYGGADARPRSAPVVLRGPTPTVVRRRSGRGMLEVRRSRPRMELADLLPGGPVPAWLAPDGVRALPRAKTGFSSVARTVFPLPRSAPSGLGLLRRIDVDLEDLDGNGLADLVLTRTQAEGGNIAKRRTSLLFFLNRQRPSRKPSQVLLLPGILSSGPELQDVDGDGNRDLFLSLFAGDLGSELSRRLFGRVDLDYHLYLGTGDEVPFSRSPHLSVTDKLADATFEVWGLRHRRLLDDDWNGDGRYDLVEIEREGKDHWRIALRLAAGRGSTYGFGDPGPTYEHSGEVSAYGVVSLATARPALRLKTPTGVVYLTLRR